MLSRAHVCAARETYFTYVCPMRPTRSSVENGDAHGNARAAKRGQSTDEARAEQDTAKAERVRERQECRVGGAKTKP